MFNLNDRNNRLRFQRMLNIDDVIDDCKSIYQMNSSSIKDFITVLPKVELHAHLNGCIRETTLLDLARRKNIQLTHLFHKEKYHKRRSLIECFELFKEIALCVTDLPTLERITMEALEDFSKSGVGYLELRSTPKILNIDDEKTELGKATKRMYIDTIIDVMCNFEISEKRKDSGRNIPLMPRFIVSINRSESIKDANENTELAIDYKIKGNKYIVGLELSGNPHTNLFKTFEPCFISARNHELCTSIHCGEVSCEENGSQNIIRDDTMQILRFAPNRLGHALLLTDEMFQYLESKDFKIPIECCPTSNVLTLELEKHVEGDLVHGLRLHPRLGKWLLQDYPISISTDDPGIFETNPSTELILLADAFAINEPWPIIRIVLNSITHSFECSEVKMMLHDKFLKRIKSMLSIRYDNSLRN